MKLEQLRQQMAFLVEIDKLKSIYRRSYLIDRSRNENDAEHSWHLAMMAMILHEHANEPSVDLVRVMKMVLLHDIVEIDAGDVALYDIEGQIAKQAKELDAAHRIYGLLPGEQRNEMFELWQEFERKETAESKFAHAVDRLSPLVLNYYTEGRTWQEHNVTLEMALKRNEEIRNGSEALWQFAQEILHDAVEKGYLPTAKQNV